MANYVMETREELRKCTWPTYDELKGSTIVVLVATAILGAFTIGADAVISQVIGLVMR
ncbi:MAG: preprotein translocase subunit SecE [Verrucomicrobia bacterium]|nr:preprotein translocase subunit SecE [Verrucomicrobiota bacterium]